MGDPLVSQTEVLGIMEFYISLLKNHAQSHIWKVVKVCNVNSLLEFIYLAELEIESWSSFTPGKQSVTELLACKTSKVLK